MISHLAGTPGELSSREAAIVGMVREMCSSSTVFAPTYTRIDEELDTEAVVELSVLVGYYTMLSYTMSAFDACHSTEDG